MMRPQLACDKVCATWVMNPVGLRHYESHVAMVAVGAFPRPMQRQGDWHRCLVHLARSRTRRRHASPARFAAMSGNQAVGTEQSKLIESLDGEGGADLRVQDRLVSSVGTAALAPASFRDWYMADKELVVVSVVGFATAGFMAILLAAAVPSLLAIKKAAEALEKLADTAREELPGTMAAIRLSGMEISDLTMELNELGQEISKGVRSSARVLSSTGSGVRQGGGVASSGTGGSSNVGNATSNGPDRKTTV